MKLTKFLFITGFLAFTLLTPPASAHNVLASADPAINSTVITLPSTVSLTFADELIALGDSNSISITDEKGMELTSGKAEVSGAVLSIKSDGSEVTGVIKVDYRAVAADGHVITGDYQFTVSSTVISETATRTLEESAAVSETGNKISIFIIFSGAIVVGLSLFFIRKRESK